MFSPRSASRQQIRQDADMVISPVLAASIAQEYASLRIPGSLPSGVYITPSIESLLSWDGVLFVHDGPYAQAVLRFVLSFDTQFPRVAPTLRFETDVYHPMIDPKSKVWTPRGHLAPWQHGVHHVVHLLRAVKAEFETVSLESVTEEQAVNKQLYSLYKNSRQTFLSMTAQRGRQSSSRDVLYHTDLPRNPTAPAVAGRMPAPSSPTSSNGSKSAVPSTPTKQTGRVRLHSGLSVVGVGSPGSVGVGGGLREDAAIRFKLLSQEEREVILKQMDEGRAQPIKAVRVDADADDPDADPFT